MKTFTKLRLFALFCLLLILDLHSFSQTLTYPIVDTGVHDFYSNTDVIIAPAVGEPFYGQDATYQGNEPSYTDNGDGTITDNVTGLMWQKDMGSKITYDEAFVKADTMTLGGYADWRVPSIKELYSLMLFTGHVNGMTPIKSFINTDYFIQPLGDTAIGERFIDAQTWSSTQYVGVTMNNDAAVFGVNFVDGRIKGYPKLTYSSTAGSRVANKMYFRMVRGNSAYGVNSLVNNYDGTVTDNATGLMWQQVDDGVARDWEDALSYAENLTLAGYSDWRLPNAKELQSIVDYKRCPDVTNSPAIDPLFATTAINYPDGGAGNYPYFWTSSSHLETSNPYSQGVYIAFGEALGKMNGVIMDVHGAGAQRSDPKTGNSSDYPQYSGPQGDMRVVFNYVRCVRDVSGTTFSNSSLDSETAISIYPNPASSICSVGLEKEYDSVQIDVYSNSGLKVMCVLASNSSRVDLYIGSLSCGIYYLRATLDNKTVLSKTLIKS